MLDPRLGHLPQELAGVSRERLDIPALALGIQGVHRQRGLARATGPAEDAHLVPGEFEVDILQVVLAGPLHHDGPRGVEHRRRPPGTTGHIARRTPSRSPRATLGLKQLLQCPPGVRLGTFGDGLGNAGSQHAAPPRSALGAHVDDPVGGLDHIEVVLDHQHRVAQVDQAVQHFEQFADVGEVQSGRRFIEQVDGLAGGPLAQFPRQLHPLRFSARQRGGRLTQLQVVQTHVVQRLQQLGDGGNRLEVPQRLLHIHVEHLGNRFPLEPHLERFVLEAVAVADRAGEPDVGEKVHFQPGRSIPLARLAATQRDVEAEPSGGPAADFRLGQLRIQVADQVKQLDVGRRVRPGGSTNRRLVDVDRLVEQFESRQLFVPARVPHPLVQVAVQRFEQYVVDQ